MQQLEYEHLEVMEELSYRIIKNYARLEGIEYRPDRIFDMGTHWPGDWEGRTRLAWVMLARASGRKPAYLAAVDALLDRKLNSRHYFKNILPEGMADEQQISGHNWFLRSLLEEYLWKKEDRAAERARKLVENLYLPLQGMYARYPLQPDERNKEGKASGHLTGEPVNGWFLSTDIGCAFMPFDGLGQYYQIFGDERVAGLLDEMAASLMQIDLVACGMQTHAALSAARGVMRYYQSTGRRELLDYVSGMFDTYLNHGMTENYANYNWFGKPAWTEPCAIVDSYLLALELFKETRNTAYIRISNRILYNALGHAQRENGGFGCDTCAGGWEHPDVLAVYEECYEASWCCSMRGGEGLSKAAAQAVLKDGKDYLFLNYIPMKYQSEELVFTVTTDYPLEGRVNVQVRGVHSSIRLKFYIPGEIFTEEVELTAGGRRCHLEWEDGLACVTVKEDGDIRLEFPIRLKREEPVREALRESYEALWYGDMLLGCRQMSGDASLICLPAELEKAEALGKGMFRLEKYVLEPVGRTIYYDKKEMLEAQFRVLYVRKE